MSMKKKDSSVRWRGFLLMSLASSMFGLGTVLAKLLGEAFNPFFVSWLSLLCGGVIVSAAQLVRRKPLLPRLTAAGWIDLIALGGIGTAMPLLCVVAGLAQTSAITGSFLLQSQGPAAILLAVLFLKEKMTWKQAGGIALLIVGSLLVIVRDLRGPLQIEGGQGDLLVLLAALGLGFSYIPGKRLTSQGDAWQIILLRLFVGSLLIVPFLPFQTTTLLVPLSITLAGILALYIVTNFGLAYVFQQMGLGLLQAWESAVLMQSLPLFGTLFALLILHESITPLQIIGGCIILLGGFLVI
ncbi:MAG TPA: DMT family transporter [Ktedonobacteraceae bacterium]|nr:DMT family transporter [Ktedonobacteraceae bacterium]